MPPRICSVALPGDFSLDGLVDAADYVVWRDGLGTDYTVYDYDIWKSHFGRSSSGSLTNVSNVAAVPEPTDCVMALAIAATTSLTPLRAGRTS